MNHKNKTIKSILFTLTILTGIVVATLIFNNGAFEYESAQAEIANVAETAANNTAAGNWNSDMGIDELGNSVVVFVNADASSNGVYYRRFSANGTALDASDVLVNTTTTNDQNQPTVAMDRSGNFVVTWASNQGANYDIYIQAFQADGTTAGSETIVNTTTSNNQLNPSIAIDYDGVTSAERFVVTWDHDNGADTDIMYQKFSVDFDTPSGPTTTGMGSETTVNTVTSGTQKNNSVAMNNLGEFIISWFGENGSGNRVVYQIYASDTATSTAIGSNTEVHTPTSLSNIYPSVAADKKYRSSLNDTEDINFVIAYESDISVSENGIAAKTISCTDPNGANSSDTDLSCTLGSVELIVSTDLTGTETNPDVAADYLGNFTVAWTDSAIDGSGNGIAAQSYNRKGDKIDSNFQVNTSNTTSNQLTPTVAMNTDGFYGISFTNANDSYYYFKTYITDIFKVDNESMTHSVAAGSQLNVATDISPNGNQVHVWKDASDSSVRFSLYEIDRTTDPSTPVVQIVNNGSTDQKNIRVDNSPTTTNPDNPDVSFFKDSANNEKFIIVWQADVGGTGTDIYYQIYDELGDPDPSYSPTMVNSATTGNQTKPTVSAGYYSDKEFAAGWIDENTDNIDSTHYTTTSGFVYAQIKSCSAGTDDCIMVSTSFQPTDDFAVYGYEVTDTGTYSDTFVQQTEDGVLRGSAIQANSTDTYNESPDIRFISDADFSVVYSKTNGSSVQTIGASEYTYNVAGNPTLIGDLSISRINVATTANQLYPQIGASIINTAANQYYQISWGLDSPAANYNVYGQLLDYSAGSGTSEFFGPNFMINSTQSNNQYIPDSAYIESGMGVTSWEGNTASADTSGVSYQLLQNTNITESVSPVVPTIAQEIITGALTMTVPTTIDFAPVDTSATESQTQTISIRDATYGGDVKYVEVQDSLGSDFTLTVQITDFSITETGPGGTPLTPETYIYNDQHFRVRNWDQSTTNTDGGNCSGNQPTDCFLTNYSSIVTTNTNLDSSTDAFLYADTQKTLMEKTNAASELEIGNWRFYPEFEITVPPFTPAGDHTATITFTLI